MKGGPKLIESKKFNSGDLMVLFVSVFPIIPFYFYIAGVSVINLVAVGFFVVEVIIISKGKLSIIRQITMLSVAFLLWVVLHSMSLLYHGELGTLIFFVFQTWGICIAMQKPLAKKEMFLKAISSIVKMSAVLSVFGIIEEITGFNVFNIVNTIGYSIAYSTRMGIQRISSYSSHSIVYGAYIMFCLSLCIYIGQFSNNKKDKIMYKVIYLLLWINILLTLSRSSILIAMVSQVLILYSMGFKRAILKTIKIVVVIALVMVVLCSLFPGLGKIMLNIGYMILAVFIDDYADLISVTFGANIHGTGNRLDLYTWVAEEMKGHWLFGYGTSASFNHAYEVQSGIYTATNIKKSIEVQYLYALFHYGVVGLIGEIILYISTVYYTYRRRKRTSWEPKINFYQVCFILFVCYYLLFFAVNQSSDRTIYYVVLVLLIMYNAYYDRYSIEKRRS